MADLTNEDFKAKIEKARQAASEKMSTTKWRIEVGRKQAKINVAARPIIEEAQKETQDDIVDLPPAPPTWKEKLNTYKSPVVPQTPEVPEVVKPPEVNDNVFEDHTVIKSEPALNPLKVEKPAPNYNITTLKQEPVPKGKSVIDIYYMNNDEWWHWVGHTIYYVNGVRYEVYADASKGAPEWLLKGAWDLAHKVWLEKIGNKANALAFWLWWAPLIADAPGYRPAWAFQASQEVFEKELHSKKWIAPRNVDKYSIAVDAEDAKNATQAFLALAEQLKKWDPYIKPVEKKSWEWSTALWWQTIQKDPFYEYNVLSRNCTNTISDIFEKNWVFKDIGWSISTLSPSWLSGSLLEAAKTPWSSVVWVKTFKKEKEVKEISPALKEGLKSNMDKIKLQSKII